MRRPAFQSDKVNDHFKLGDRLEVSLDGRIENWHRTDLYSTISTLRVHSDIGRIRGVMVRLGHGNVCRMPDDIIVREMARIICLRNYALLRRGYRPLVAHHEAPPGRKTEVVPPSAVTENPFLETAKRDRMVVKTWGIEIGGGILAYNLYEHRIGQLKRTANPFLDPDDEKLRLQNAEKRARAAAALEGTAITRRYQRDVIVELTKIRRAQTGLAVFRALNRALTKVAIRIDPWTKPGANAASRPQKVFEKEKRDPLASFPEEIEFRRRQRWPALVLYTPATWKRVEQETWSDLGIVLNDEEGPGSAPEEVLLHELFHALRIAMGISVRRNPMFQKKRYQGSTGRDGLEEFYAILVANIYRSELGRDIRFGHSNFDKSWESVKEFLNTALNRTHIRMMRRRMPVLFNDLKKIDVPWNPLKEFKDAS